MNQLAQLKHEVRAHSLALIPYCLTVKAVKMPVEMSSKKKGSVVPFIFTTEGLAVALEEKKEPLLLQLDKLLAEEPQYIEEAYKKLTCCSRVSQAVPIVFKRPNSWELICLNSEILLKYILGAAHTYTSLLEQNIEHDKQLYVKGKLFLPDIACEDDSIERLKNVRDILSDAFSAPLVAQERARKILRFSAENYCRLHHMLNQLPSIQEVNKQNGLSTVIERMYRFQTINQEAVMQDPAFKCVVECVKTSEKENIVRVRSTCAGDYPYNYLFLTFKYSPDSGKHEYIEIGKSNLQESSKAFPYLHILLTAFLEQFHKNKIDA